MNGEHANPEFDGLESPLDLAVRAVLAEPLPQEAIDRVKSRATELAPRADRRIDHLGARGIKIWKRPLARLAVVAAACLVVLGIWLFVPGRQTTVQAFNQLAERLVAAKTARYDMEVSTEGEAKQSMRAYYLAPGRFRNEMHIDGVVSVIDLAAKKMVLVNPRAKRVVILNWKGNPPKTATVGNQFERLRLLLSKSHEASDVRYERIGEKQIDGRRAVGFRLDSPAVDVTLWGDPATGYPVLVETVWSGRPLSKTTMKNFEINIPLEASLFEITPPAGYTVQSLDAEYAEPSEQGLVNAFRTASDIGQGRFPDSLDTMGMMKLLEKAFGKGKKKPSDAELKRVMKLAMSVGSGYQFALDLPESADTHYAGNGVERNAKDRPIFWYKPEGSSKYRVIFADLSVKDEPTAPQVPGAQRIKKTSQTATPAAK
jgi:outer membrane lipoprotein-sorting protein